MGVPGKGRAVALKAATPGKRTLVDGMVRRPTSPAVQLKHDVAAPGAHAIGATAEAGLVGHAGPLPFRDQMEQGFGVSFEDVRVHDNQHAASAADALGAQGYTMGSDIALAAPATPELVAHELAHVVQQRAGSGPSSGVGVAGDAFEIEADTAAAQIAAGGTSDLSDRYGGNATGSAIQRRAVQRWATTDIDFESVSDTVADSKSRTPDKTKAKKEKDYKPPGPTGAKVGEGHYRLWGFDVGSAELPNYSRELLIKIMQIITDDPSAAVAIHGHTSQSGEEAGNIGLSMDRAQAVIADFRNLRANTQHCTPYAYGEASPLVDESEGPAAMARNRRVEIFVTPGQKQPASTPADQSDAAGDDLPPRKGCHISIGEADLYRRQALAQAQLWTLQQAKGMSGGRPTLGFGDTNVQPDFADWKIACEGNGVPREWCDFLYDTLSFPIDGNWLTKINDSTREAEFYQGLIDKGTCTPGTGFPSPPGSLGQPADPMPGDRDPKGRYY